MENCIIDGWISFRATFKCIAKTSAFVAIATFTALHAMQTRSSDQDSVCVSVYPSVRLSVCHTRAL